MAKTVAIEFDEFTILEAEDSGGDEPYFVWVAFEGEYGKPGSARVQWSGVANDDWADDQGSGAVPIPGKIRSIPFTIEPRPLGDLTLNLPVALPSGIVLTPEDVVGVPFFGAMVFAFDSDGSSWGTIAKIFSDASTAFEKELNSLIAVGGIDPLDPGSSIREATARVKQEAMPGLFGSVIAFVESGGDIDDDIGAPWLIFVLGIAPPLPQEDSQGSGGPLDLDLPVPLPGLGGGSGGQPQPFKAQTIEHTFSGDGARYRLKATLRAVGLGTTGQALTATKKLPPAIPQMRPASCVRTADHLDVVVADRFGRVRATRWSPTSSWSTPRLLGKGLVAPHSPVTLVSRAPGHLDAFVVGLDGRVHTAWWTDATGAWDGWHRIKDLRTLPGSPISAVSRSFNKIDLVVAGSDGHAYTAAWAPEHDDGWRGWWRIGSGCVVPPRAHLGMAVRRADHLDVFVVAADRRIRTAWWRPGLKGWGGWQEISPKARAEAGAPVTAVSRSQDHLDIFVVGTNGHAYSAAWTPSAGWKGFWSIGDWQFPQGAELGAAIRNKDHLDIFGTDATGRIATAWWRAGMKQWGGWQQVRGGKAQPGAAVTAVSRSTDKLDVFVAANGRTFTAWWGPEAGWGGWSELP